MSAIGPKQTWASAPHMSAFGVKADMTVRGKSAFAVAIRVKRTWPIAVRMSAFDPKRTLHLGHSEQAMSPDQSRSAT
jgi:hypothetical protein